MLAALLLPAGSQAAVEDLTVDRVLIVKKKRSSQHARYWYFIYKVTVSNPGGDLAGVTARVRSLDSRVRVVDRRLRFGDLAAGETKMSMDTFVVRAPRGRRIRPEVFVFDFAGEAVGATDTTPPTIRAEVQPPANANGWHNTDVTVSFVCEDAESGVASCPAPVVLRTEGADQKVQGEAVDNAGNRASVSVTLNIDKTPPQVSVSLAPGSDTPPLGDGRTLLQDIAVLGVTEPGLAVELHASASFFGPAASGTAGADGAVAFGGIGLLPGDNALALRATDLAGNVGEATLAVFREACHDGTPGHAFLVAAAERPAAGADALRYDPQHPAFAGEYGQLEVADGDRVEVVAAGLDGDARVDWVTVDTAGDRVLVFLNDGGAALPPPAAYASGAGGPVAIAVADFVGDAAPDIAVGHGDGSLTFLEGTGSGAFRLRPAVTVGAPGAIRRLVAADLDGDGDADLVAATADGVFLVRNERTARRTLHALANGDFATGLNGWRVEAVGHAAGEAPGSVSADGGAAVLRENRSFRVTLAQTFRLGDAPSQIAFDLPELRLDAPDGGIPDAFEASLLDAANRSLVPTVDAAATSFFNVNPGGVVQTAAGVRFDGSRVTLDVSSLAPGTEATLYFDLIGNPPGGGSRVVIDNVDAGPGGTRNDAFALSALAGPFQAVGGVDHCGVGASRLLVADPGQGDLFIYTGTGDGGFERSLALPLGGL